MTGIQPEASFQNSILGSGCASTVHSRSTVSPSTAMVMPAAVMWGPSATGKGRHCASDT